MAGPNAVANRDEIVPPPSPPPPPPARTATEAVGRIEGLLHGRTGSNPAAAREALQALPPEQHDAAVAKLSDADLRSLVDGAGRGSHFGEPGLSVDARRDLFNDLARSVSGPQLARIADRVAPEHAGELAAAVDRFAPAPVRAAFDRGPAAEEAITGLGAASGREQYVRAQTDRAARAAANQGGTHYDGELYRAVPTNRYQTYADHSWSGGGRYNAPGQSALYTAPSLGDLRAELGNYSGLDGNTVLRSRFTGDLLDARSLPGVRPSALTEPHGMAGAHRTALARITGEDAYTIPRAVGDQARLQGLNGVIAPANDGDVNVALFPDDPNAAASGPGRIEIGLRYLDHQSYAGGATTPPAVDPAVRPPIADVTPNRASPAGGGVDTYAGRLAADADAHARASGARYGAAGAVLASLVESARTGEFSALQTGGHMAAGAALGHADTVLGRAIDNVVRPPVAPPNVAGGASAGRGALSAAPPRPVNFGAGVASGGAIGGVVSGGVSVFTQADAVRSGEVDAGQATANAAVDTGVGIAAGASGAAVGAAVGSVVPVAGTAVGAVVGFGVGVGASWLAQNSGVADAAKARLGQVLTDNFERPLDRAWEVAGQGVDAVQDAAGAVRDTASSAWNKVTSWF